MILLAWAGVLLTMAVAGTADFRTLLQDLEKAVAASGEEDCQTISLQIEKSGPGAVPYLRESLLKGTAEMKPWCLRILCGIGGDESTELLSEVYLNSSDRKLTQNALACLVNRPIRRRLSEREITLFSKDIISQDSDIGAGTAARVLSLCQGNEAGQLIPSILQRFIGEVEDPRDLGMPDGMGYLSPGTSILNQFLLAFRNIGPAGIPSVQSEMRSTPEPLLRKWLLLALGFMRDPTVGAQLLTILESDPDRYTRALALRAYSLSAGTKAIPILRKYLNDPTESEYGDCVSRNKVLLFQLIARDELFRLEKEP